MTTNLNDIIPDLIERRKCLGLSLQQLADRAGVGAGNIHQWESYKFSPRSDLFFAWCAALGLEIKVVTIPTKKILRETEAHATG